MKWAPFSQTGRRSLLESTARLNIWEGAVRSGKTVASLIRWIEFIAASAPGPLLMVGKTERTLKRNILDPLQDILGASRMRINTGTGEAKILKRRVYLAGANDERAEQKIRGLTLAGAYGDELTLWPESFFKMLLSRLSAPGAALFGTTNPDSPYHWLKRDYLDRAQELDLASWSFKLADNLSLDESYVRNLGREYTGLWRRRFIEGAWVVAEGVIYDMFDPERHVFQDGPSGTHETYVGVDYGTTNPTVFLKATVDGTGCVWVIDEWRYDSSERGGRQMSDVEFSAALKAFAAGSRFIFIDPSAASLRVQAYHDGIRNAAPADNAVLDGIRNVAGLLASNRLLISGKCKGLLSEMTTYSWDPAAQKRGADAPLKQGDHSVDALRYLVRGTRAYWSRFASN